MLLATRSYCRTSTIVHTEICLTKLFFSYSLLELQYIEFINQSLWIWTPYESKFLTNKFSEVMGLPLCWVGTSKMYYYFSIPTKTIVPQFTLFRQTTRNCCQNGKGFWKKITQILVFRAPFGNFVEGWLQWSSWK